MEKISINLFDTGSIQEAIREIKLLERKYAERTEILKERVAESVGKLAQNGFNGAIVSDFTDGTSIEADVNVFSEKRGDMYVVIADGEDAVFVEFGAGVYHNGSVGTSPHPNGNELGMTIGSYGKGKGKQKAWGYYEGGDLFITHGCPATMPMLNAAKAVCSEIDKIAKEVFK